jgi:4-hydroxyproline epimerase
LPGLAILLSWRHRNSVSELQEVPGGLVSPAVFKTVGLHEKHVVGGFDSHALPLNSRRPQNMTSCISVIDSHTEGEPTRVIVQGVPEIPGNTLREKRENFRKDFDWVRTACVLEPRGHEALVGALLCESRRDDCVAGVVFFNNAGVLHGCIHGTIGVARTLQHMGRVGPGRHGIEIPAGRVEAHIHDDGLISVANVRSYRHLADVELAVPGFDTVRGDVAWGGNWFFLAHNQTNVPLRLGNVRFLADYCQAIRDALHALRITGSDNAEIDHVELFEPHPVVARADSRNYVHCPGGAYDRSPCGTGTSAKLACLFADGQLSPGSVWRQASIIDTVFLGSVTESPDGGVIPTVAGRAWVNGEANLLIDPDDPFRFGIV